MLHVVDTLLLRPSFTLCASSLAQVCAFREDQKPHRILGVAKLAQMPLEATLVCFPFSRQEDEVVELSAPAEDGNILQGLLEDDIDATVHLVGVCDPPEV
jgi:hypothetical protein